MQSPTNRRRHSSVASPIRLQRPLAWSCLLLLAVSCFEKGQDTAVPTANDIDGDGISVEQGDCDDNDASIYPEAEEVPYDGVDQDCDGEDLIDVDGDGWEASETGGDDCDDQDASTNPAADEIPYDGADNDCEGDGDLTDVDGDGYDSDTVGGDDCDDYDDEVHPGAVDDCGGGDEDCDGEEDEDEDADGDGFSSCSGDCDDSDASINPDAEEIAQDGIDQNCNGVDRGSCPDEILDQRYRFEIQAYLDNCEGGIMNAQSHFWDSEYVPEDASCNGTSSGSWNDTYSGEFATVNVDVSISFTSRSGSISGHGSYDGYSCDDVSGTIEID
jgi:hypothetical protein